MTKTMRALAALMILALCLPARPARAAEARPDVYAKAYVLMEPTTGRVLAEQNAKAKIYPASMTKTLTALILLEYFQPDEVIICGSEINSVPYDSSKAKLAEGEGITVQNLVRALLIESGGDAAAVAAVAVAKRAARFEDTSTYARAEKAFRTLMNEKAAALGCEGSNFTKPDGYHDDNHFSTAYDMALIARAALSNRVIMQIAAEPGFEGVSAAEPPNGEYTVVRHKWTNRNMLISDRGEFYPYATGLKTGATDEAGECLMAAAEKDGVTLISITCDSPIIEQGDASKTPTRWSDNRALFDWGFENYHFETIQTAGEPLGVFKVDNPQLGAEAELPLAAVDGVTDFLSLAEAARVKRDVSLLPEASVYNDETGETSLKTPVERGQAVGRVAYTLDGAELFSGEAVADGEARERTFNSDVDYYVALWKARLFGAAALPWWIVAGLCAVICALVAAMIRGGRKRRNPYNR